MTTDHAGDRFLVATPRRTHSSRSSQYCQTPLFRTPLFDRATQSRSEGFRTSTDAPHSNGAHGSLHMGCHRQWAHRRTGLHILPIDQQQHPGEAAVHVSRGDDQHLAATSRQRHRRRFS